MTKETERLPEPSPMTPAAEMRIMRDLSDEDNALCDRLAETRDEIERIVRQLADARARRDDLLRLLDHLPDRFVAGWAGVSGPAVSQIRSRRKADLDE